MPPSRPVPQPPPLGGFGSNVTDVGASATPSTVALIVPLPAAVAVTLVVNAPAASVVPLVAASAPMVLDRMTGRPAPECRNR